jgi:DNA-binding NtrC family response regulator
LVACHGSKETVILLAEDDVTLRNLIALMLSRNGYHVLTAVNGSEALEIFRKFADTISLLLTDIDMPGISGVKLAAEIALLHPQMKIVMMSGAHDNVVLAGNVPHAFLSKPFIPPTLLKAIEEVLDGKRPTPADL